MSYGASLFSTFRIDDEDPCNVCEVDSTPINVQLASTTDPELVSAQFVGGSVVLSSLLDRTTNQVTPVVLQGTKQNCEPRYVTAKPLSNQTPSKHCALIVKKGPVAEDNTFCAPCNPVELVCDADPCHANLECRAVQRAAGAHLPCATLQVDSVPVKNDFFTTAVATGNVLIANGCQNENGCEFLTAYSNNADSKLGAFVVRQSFDEATAEVVSVDGGTYTNAVGNVPNSTPVDLACMQENAFGLTSSTMPTQNLIVNIKQPTSVVAIPPGAASTVVPMIDLRTTVFTFDKNRNRILVGSADGKVLAVALDTFPNSTPTVVFSLTDLFIGDMKVIGDSLFIVGTLNSGNVDDSYLLYNLLTDFGPEVFSASGRRSFAFADIQAGIAAHAIAPVLYVAQTATDNESLIITAVKIDPDDATNFTIADNTRIAATISGSIDMTATSGTAVLQRLRPRYCDGALQCFSRRSGDGSAAWAGVNMSFNGLNNAFLADANGAVSLTLSQVCGPSSLDFKLLFQSTPIDVSINGVVETLFNGTYTRALPLLENEIVWSTATGSTGDAVQNVTVDGVDMYQFLVNGAVTGSAPNPACFSCQLTTLCASDNNPLELTLASDNAVPEALLGLEKCYPRHAQSTNGLLLFAAETQLVLAQPDECNPRYLNKKYLLSENPTDQCKTVTKKAEFAANASFCNVENPYNTVYNLDCDPGKDCRAVSRPAGTHFPCATLQVQSGPVYDQNDIIDGNGAYVTVSVWASKPNQYGCEFVVTWGQTSPTGPTNALRFVLDQDCVLRNAVTGVAVANDTPADLGTPATFSDTEINDFLCHNGVSYLATRANFVIDVFATTPTQVAVSQFPLCAAVQERNGRYAYIGVRDEATIQICNLDTATIVGAIALETNGNANCRAVDIVACGTSLIVAQINYGSGPNDAVALYDFSQDAEAPQFQSVLVLADQNSGNNSVTGTTIWPGLAHHPTESIVYVTGRTTNSDVTAPLYLKSLSYESSFLTQYVNLEFSANPNNVPVSQKRLRPIFLDNVLTLVYPQPSSCAMSVVRVADTNPLDIETISTVTLNASPAFDDCYERFAVANSGLVLLTSVNEIGVFKPEQSSRLYINDKPFLMNLPSNVVLLARETNRHLFQNSNDDSRSIPPNTNVFLQFGDTVNFISNLPLISLSDPTLQSTTLFQPPSGRPVLVSLNGSFLCTGSPHFIRIYGDDGDGNQSTFDKYFVPSVIAQQVLEYCVTLPVSNANFLRIELYPAVSTQTNLLAESFSLEYLYDI